MTLEFKLPDIGEGIAEGEIVKWLVAEGDTVDEHQLVVEVMTDKATVEVPAPQAGTITELRAAEGDVVPVGDVIFVLGEGGGAAPKAKESSPEPEPARAQAPQEAAPEEAAPEEAAPEKAPATSSCPTSARASPRARSSSGSSRRATRSRSTSRSSR